MRRLRFSVAFLMVVSAIIALDMAVMRSLMRDAPGSNQTLYLVPIDGTHWMDFAALSLGVLPMASLLLLVAIFQMPKVWRTGTVAGFWLGFATFGSFSLFLFVIISSLSPAAIQNYLMMIEGPIVAPIYGSIGNEPAEWLVERGRFGDGRDPAGASGTAARYSRRMAARTSRQGDCHRADRQGGVAAAASFGRSGRRLNSGEGRRGDTFYHHREGR